MQNKLKAFVRYSEDGKVTPGSLVRMAGRPRMKGRYLQVYKLCCDPEYTQFIGAGRDRAFVQVDKQGNPLGGPIIRGLKPKSGYWMEIPYNICCDVNQSGELPVIIQQPEYDAEEDTITVVASGEGLTYSWEGFDEDGQEWITFETTFGCYEGINTNVLAILTGECPIISSYRVVVTNSTGSVTSEEISVP